MKLNQNEKKAFETVPSGTQCARLIHLVDLGTQHTEFGGKSKDKRQLRLTWELVDAPMADGRNFVIGKTVSASLYKSSLLNIIESMQGKSIEFEADGSFDMKQLLGEPCMITVIHESKEGKTYANIGAISPLPKIKGKLVDCAEQTNHLINFGLDAYDQDTFDMVPKWIQATIEKSPEYREAVKGTRETVSKFDVEDSIPF